jgi:hypothetical protein
MRRELKELGKLRNVILGVLMTRFFVLCVTWCAIWDASIALGCECAPTSVNESKESSEVVFRGTITAIRGGKVSFRVNRVWKGEVGQTFEMVEMRAGIACLGFSSGWLAVGNDLLIFASRLHRYPGDEDYFTDVCSGTRLGRDAGETLAKLGKGGPPRSAPAPRRP